MDHMLNSHSSNVIQQWVLIPLFLFGNVAKKKKKNLRRSGEKVIMWRVVCQWAESKWCTTWNTNYVKDE